MSLDHFGKVEKKFSVVDFETENDGCVTIRHRDSMTQERVKIEELNNFIAKSLEF